MDKLEERIEIANSQQQHSATVLLLDASSSMTGDKISQLNEGIKFFKDDVLSKDLVRKGVDLSVVIFGDGVSVAHYFSSIEEFEPPTLVASGVTPMGEAILKAIDLVEQRKTEYKTKGVDYFRPWIFMITDGEPTDMQPGDSMWNDVVKKIHDGEANKKFLFFTLGVEPANMQLLKQIAPPERKPLELKQGMFKEMFAWLSKSRIKSSSVETVGEQVALDNPASPDGWGMVPTD